MLKRPDARYGIFSELNAIGRDWSSDRYWEIREHPSTVEKSDGKPCDQLLVFGHLLLDTK